MKPLSPLFAFLLLGYGVLVGAQDGRQVSPTRLTSTLGKLPLYFVENRGVFPDEVAYYIQGADKTLYFTKDGITFRLYGKERGWVVKLEFVGAELVAPRGEERQQAVFSYFKGPKKDWKTGLCTYSRVVYENLWPGIDLVYRGDKSRLKYDFIVKPGADPDQIRLRYRGATEIALTDGGGLLVATPVAVFEDEMPVAHQARDGRSVSVSFFLGESEAIHPDAGRVFGFRVGPYNPTSVLVIDPALLVYCGYIGGADLFDIGRGIALDSAGHAYVAGMTYNTEATFPVVVGPDLTFNGSGTDGFVAKVDPTGTQLVYCGYIGGGSGDSAAGVSVDAFGCAYVTGVTWSDQNSFPVRIGPDLIHNGQADAFVAKVNAQGTGLDYCGYLGGISDEEGFGIAVDASGAVNMVGMTCSDETTFPVRLGPDLTFNGMTDAFVARVDPTGTQIVYCGYIGGSGKDQAARVAVDRTGHACVTGDTDSDETTFPVRVGPDLKYNGGRDAFVAKVTPDGTSLVFCGYVGGSSGEYGHDIALDLSDNIFVVGSTDSDERTFPVKVGPDLTFNGPGTHYGFGDAFVAKLDSRGTSLHYCGYIGGNGLDGDCAYGVAVDAMGNAYVAGMASSDETTFPVKIGPDLTYNGPWLRLNMGDGFVAKVNPQGTALAYCGYIGGVLFDACADVAVDVTGNAYMTGWTQSDESTFPVTIGPDLTYNDPGPPVGGDAFVAAVGTVFLTGGGLPRPGGRVTLTLRAYEDPSYPYQLGSSFGTGPIPIGPRRLCLDPDMLLVVSSSGQWPGIFEGYRGILDAQGHASAAIRIPDNPALVGLRIHTAFVTLDPRLSSGIRSISNTFSFSIMK